MSGGSVSPSFYVCQVKDTEGTITFEAIQTSKVDDRIDQLKKAYAEACKAWTVAAKEAKNAGTEFTDPKPQKPAFRKAVTKKVSPKAKADSLAALYQEKWDERVRQKEAADAKGDEPAKTTTKS